MLEEENTPITKEGEIKKPIDAFFTSVARCKGYMTDQEHEILHEVVEICESTKKEKIKWVDICCGRGTILDHAVEYLQEDHKRLTYYAFDREEEFIRDLTDRHESDQIKIKCKPLPPGDIDYLEKHANLKDTYDFITLENVLHEISPVKFPDLFLNCLRMCSEKGVFFIIDMQKLPVPECDAIAWSRDDIEVIIGPLFDDKTNIPKVRQIPAQSKRGDIIPLFCVRILKSKINCELINEQSEREKAKKTIRDKTCKILRKKKKGLAKEIDSFLKERKDKDPIGKTVQIRIPPNERFTLINLYEQYLSVDRALAIMHKI